MTSIELSALLPLIIITAAAVLVMLLAAVRRIHLVSFILSELGLAAAFISLFTVSGQAPLRISNLLVIDSYSIYYMGLIFASTFLILLLSYSYFENHKENKDEYYILVLTAVLGSSILVASTHFISLFLGLEILTVSLYTMIAYFRRYSLSVEAGLKYLILAAVSSAFLLFGMALLYTALGSMEFSEIGRRFMVSGASPLVVTGMALIVVGIGFKLAVVPFHMWTPDVYQGASAPVSAFIASVSKGGMFALLIRFFMQADSERFAIVFTIFSVIAAASMIIGNLLALSQNNVKRILAYSSIANLGYLLVAFIAGGVLGVEAATFYLTAYFIAIIASFGIITLLSAAGKEADHINDFRGMFWRKPFLAAVFTAMLLSLAGIPLTAGFVGKFLLLSAGVNSALWMLSIVLVLTSVIGLYYYLRIITAMFSKREDSSSVPVQKFSITGSTAILSLFILVIWFGVFPSGIMDTIRDLIAGLF